LRRPDIESWQRLKRAAGDTLAETTLDEMFREGSVTVLWVRLWDNDPRALQVWEQLSSRGDDRSLIALAAADVARVIESQNPTKAGELYLISAREHIEGRTPSAYRESASLLRKARDAYTAAGQGDLAASRVARFRAEHRRFRRLMEAFDEAGL
jgi:hypothetical protein